MAKNKPDPATVQFSIVAKVPKGYAVSKKVLSEARDYFVEHKKPPKGFAIRAIMWRNAARKGKLNYWRYSAGSDTNFIKQVVKNTGVPAENKPRGSHADAADTLPGLLLAAEL